MLYQKKDPNGSCITAYCLHHLKFFRVNIKHRRPFSTEFPYNASSDPCCTRIFLTMFCQRLESSFPCKCSTSIIHRQRQPKCTLNVIKSTALTNLTIYIIKFLIYPKMLSLMYIIDKTVFNSHTKQKTTPLLYL